MKTAISFMLIGILAASAPHTITIDGKLYRLVESPAPEIVLIIDRSGSMASMENEMEEALTGFLEKQRGFGPTVTLVQFDDQYECRCRGVTLAEVEKIDIEPRGRTALLDAMGRTLIDAERRCPAGKVIVVIVTDGLENSSREFSREQVFWHVSHLKNMHNWQFVYLGANQDAIAVGGSMGIDLNYDFTLSNLSEAVDCVNTTVSDYLDADLK